MLGGIKAGGGGYIRELVFHLNAVMTDCHHQRCASHWHCATERRRHACHVPGSANVISASGKSARRGSLRRSTVPVVIDPQIGSLGTAGEGRKHKMSMSMLAAYLDKVRQHYRSTVVHVEPVLSSSNMAPVPPRGRLYNMKEEENHNGLHQNDGECDPLSTAFRDNEQRDVRCAP